MWDFNSGFKTHSHVSVDLLVVHHKGTSRHSLLEPYLNQEENSNMILRLQQEGKETAIQGLYSIVLLEII